MKFGKIAVFGILLSMCVPSAFATRLYGSISTSGSAVVNFTGIYPNDVATNIKFANTVTSKTNVHYGQSPGGYISSDGNFGIFNSSASIYYVPGATSTNQVAGAYVTCTATITTNCRTAAGYTFPTGGTTVNGVTTLNKTLATPVELFTVSEGANTLVFYLTEVDTTTAGVNQVKTGKVITTPGVASGLTGIGYVILNGNINTKTYGDYSRIAGVTGTGTRVFSSTFTAFTPEPSSLALLGTGMFGVAGFVFRKRGKIQE